MIICGLHASWKKKKKLASCSFRFILRAVRVVWIHSSISKKCQTRQHMWYYCFSDHDWKKLQPTNRKWLCRHKKTAAFTLSKPSSVYCSSSISSMVSQIKKKRETTFGFLKPNMWHVRTTHFKAKSFSSTVQRVQQMWTTEVMGVPFSEYHLSQIIYIMDYSY